MVRQNFKEMSEQNKNHFLYKKIFPDVKTLFTREHKTTEEIFKNALFVLDTNTLLMPFSTGKENIEEIEKIYKSLIKEKRLYIPEHVLREFAKNRSIKISELYTNIDNALSSMKPINDFEYPILGELDAYKNIKENRKSISEVLIDYKKNLKKLKSGITQWNWSDPVSSMYHKIFSENIIIDTQEKESDLIKEYEERMENEIPPGNKDKSKVNNAIGDFIIWKSILELGKKEKRDVIFISNDEKNDWLLKGNKKSISTKFELVDEYYRISDGNHFISMTFSDFLEKQGLDIEIFDAFEQIFKIENIKNLEQTITLKSLDKIYHLLIKYLNRRKEYPNDDGVYIDGFFETVVNDFQSSYTHEFGNKEKWGSIFDYFFRLEEVATDIAKLNSEIIFHDFRKKKSTISEQIQLAALAKEFINTYDELRLLI